MYIYYVGNLMFPLGTHVSLGECLEWHWAPAASICRMEMSESVWESPWHLASPLGRGRGRGAPSWRHPQSFSPAARVQHASARICHKMLLK